MEFPIIFIRTCADRTINYLEISTCNGYLAFTYNTCGTRGLEYGSG